MSGEDCIAPEAPAPSAPASSARLSVASSALVSTRTPQPVGVGCCLVVSLLTDAERLLTCFSALLSFFGENVFSDPLPTS